jgi:lipopolysaccharide export system protein LptA
MTCNRLTVYLSAKDESQPSAGTSVIPATDEKAVLAGVSRILADGDVLLVQRPADPSKLASELQTSHSDHLEYDTRRGIIILTGDQNNPTLTRGTDTKLSGRRIELLRHEDKMFVMQDCRIQSLVRDKRGMLAYTREITSDRANFDGRTNVANFHGNVTAVDQMTTLKTDSLRAHLTVDQTTSSHKLDLLFGSGNVCIISVSEKDDPDNPGKRITSRSTINSRQAELNFRKNKIVFYNDVKIRDNAASLDCDRLDLFLADRQDNSPGTEKISRAPFAAGMEGKNKTITKMVALGNVVMISENDELKTDMLSLFFRDLPKGAKPSPGMIQSGGVQLTKILCDGSVQATSVEMKDGKKEVRVLKAANAKSDLIANYSEFHGSVSIKDGITEIYCRDMYIFTGASPVNEVIIENGNTQVAAGPKVSEEEALDADPFAMDMGENSVPKRIAISDTHDLKRVVCKREVVLLRRDKNGKLQRAGGDQAVYTVDTREVVLTAERPRRPWLRSEGRKQFCDIIRSDMATEDLRGIGNVEVMPDNE